MEKTQTLPPALSMLSSERPRNVGWFGAGALLFGDWGTSRLYVLGLAFLVGGTTSFYLIAGMSVLILAVGWAYTQICRIYPDGGGVYTAAKQQSQLLAVVGALLLFADYTVTASLSAVDAFHYFGLGHHRESRHSTEKPGSDIRLEHDNFLSKHLPELPAEVAGKIPQKHSGGISIWYDAKAGNVMYSGSMSTVERDQLLGWSTGAGWQAAVKSLFEQSQSDELWSFKSPGFWALVSILVIGAFNLMGPKHTAGFAIFAAAGMVVITLLLVAFAVPQIDWRHLDLGTLNQRPTELWRSFVAIVLALSGVEAIANLTGVMKKPVYGTASKSIWLVALEVAAFNLLLAVAMVALAPGRQAHTEDMLAYMAGVYVGPWGEWPVRIIGGMLLLSATNTAVNGLMSIVYVMSRDGELPRVFQSLNGFGAPWVGAIVAAGVPALVLLFAHDIETLASLYAIGVVGAVAINCALCTGHPRLRKFKRKIPMAVLAALLMAIWVTLAFTKIHALVFVLVVLAIGLSLREATRYFNRRRPKPSLLRQAIMEQLPPGALARPRMLLATAGSDQMATAALEAAKQEEAALVVVFVREVSLSYKVDAETRLTLDTDPAAQALFTSFLEHGYKYGVPIIPMYDSGPDSTEMIAELAALNGVRKVMIGSSRRGLVHQLIKGSFQRKLEALLPVEIPVEVLGGA